jgi:hypothetical protein
LDSSLFSFPMALSSLLIRSEKIPWEGEFTFRSDS